MWWSVNVLWKTSFKMFVMFLPIFVADTKITFTYKFIAPLNPNIRYYWSLKILHMLYQRIRSSYWAILPLFLWCSVWCQCHYVEPLLAGNKQIIFFYSELFICLSLSLYSQIQFFFFFCTSYFLPFWWPT